MWHVMVVIHVSCHQCMLAVGPGEEDGQAATIITNHPAPLDWPLYYFEVEIVDK